MSTILILIKKDLQSFYSRPLFWIIAGLCALIWSPVYFTAFGLFLSQMVSVMGPQGEFLSFHDRVVSEFASLVNFMMLLFANGITMKLLAEEKKNHTFELLLTSPITSGQIVVAKYITSLIVVGSLLLLSAMYPLSTAFLGKVHFGPLLSTYLGLFLFAAVYCAVGLLGSSLSSSVMVAFLISLILNLSLWFLGVGAEISSDETLARFFTNVDLVPMFKDFSSGVIRLQAFLYLASLSLIAIIITERVVESARWK